MRLSQETTGSTLSLGWFPERRERKRLARTTNTIPKKRFDEARTTFGDSGVRLSKCSGKKKAPRGRGRTFLEEDSQKGRVSVDQTGVVYYNANGGEGGKGSRASGEGQEGTGGAARDERRRDA